jgi:hypothetical protein
VRSPAAPASSSAVPGRALTTLAAVSAVLAAAFVVAPRLLVTSGSGTGFADEPQLIGAFRDAFAGQWRSGQPSFSADLADIVDYWFRYHLAKAAIAALLVMVFVALGVLLWQAFLRAGELRTIKRAALASAGASVTALALFSLAVVMANIQGAVAPFASLLPMLMGGTPAGGASDTVEQIRQRLADSLNSGATIPPTLQTIISDFSRFHLAMAVIAAIVALSLIGVSVALWKRFASTTSSDRRTRRVWGSLATALAASSLIFAVLAIANTTTAAHPGPALTTFFDGGW